MPKLLPINGWLNLNKPLGITSARAVSIVKRHFHPLKIGHAGTLDPLASGVLPLALGEATKTIQFCMDNNKEYEFTVKWGEETTTCDTEGEILYRSDVRPTLEQINIVIPEFTGQINQAPPQYSAIKIDGKRAYDLAREGIVIEMKERQVQIHSLSLLKSDKDSATFVVTCGKGTYVRSLARDIALKLNTFGHVTTLTRTKVGKFTIGDAILLEDIEKAVYKDANSGVLLPVSTVLDDIQVLELKPEEATKLKFGQKIPVEHLSENASFHGNFITKCNGNLVAICEFGEGLIKPIRVFNL